MATDFLADIEVAAIPRNRHSISEIETYLRCPAKWQYKYVQGLEDPSGPEAQWGSLFHSAVEAHYTGRSLPAMPEDVQAAWAVYEREIAARVRPLEGWTERWVEWDLGGVPMHGRIDCVDDQLTVRDTKTKKRRPSQDEVHHSLQLTAYWEGVRQTLGEMPKAVAWDVLVRNKQPVAETYLADRTPGDVARLTRIVHTVLEQADKGLIYPRWGAVDAYCGGCPFRNQCLEDYQ